MSNKVLYDNFHKVWVNPRVNNLFIDGKQEVPQDPNAGYPNGNVYIQPDTGASPETNSVTADAENGVINTVAFGSPSANPAVAPFGAFVFRVNNSKYDATNDQIFLGQINSIGTVALGNGIPHVKICETGTNYFDLEISNVHNVNSLSAISGLFIPFYIYHTVA